MVHKKKKTYKSDFELDYDRQSREYDRMLGIKPEKSQERDYAKDLENATKTFENTKRTFERVKYNVRQYFAKRKMEKQMKEGTFQSKVKVSPELLEKEAKKRKQYVEVYE